jgi:hypothetical protein
MTTRRHFLGSLLGAAMTAAARWYPVPAFATGKDVLDWESANPAAFFLVTSRASDKEARIKATRIQDYLNSLFDKEKLDAYIKRAMNDWYVLGRMEQPTWEQLRPLLRNGADFHADLLDHSPPRLF